MNIDLYQHQIDAIDKLKNGSILCGGVGSGKSRTAIAYFYKKVCLGNFKINGVGRTSKMAAPRNLYIITTAKKRDSFEWEDECGYFCITSDSNLNPSHITLKVDSWNNIAKYTEVRGAFFIFDEQRVVGSGVWVKAFLKITKANRWILLSATPGDTWMDYLPVFMANGFYRTRKEFIDRHCIYSRFSKYPKIDRYIEQDHLKRLRDSILVTMDFVRITVPHKETIICPYNQVLYKDYGKNRFNYEKDRPIRNISELCYLWRKVGNSDPSRIERVKELLEVHNKAIIFYNFDYELDALKTLDICYAQWNGHVHEPVPDGDRWAYFVQYSAGSEGWNCITTDTIIFYSQSYSYKMTIQAEGRTDRLNTPYRDLYYYYLRSNSPIDLAISRALKMKKNFNERGFV